MEEKPAEQKPRIFFALPPPAASPQGAQPEPSREAWPTKPARRRPAKTTPKTSRKPPEYHRRSRPENHPENPRENHPENLPKTDPNTSRILGYCLFCSMAPCHGGGGRNWFSGGFRVVFRDGFRLGFRAPSGRRPPRRFVEDHAYDAGAAGGLASSFPRRDGRSTHKHRRDRLASTISRGFRSAGFSSMGSLML